LFITLINSAVSDGDTVVITTYLFVCLLAG